MTLLAALLALAADTVRVTAGNAAALRAALDSAPGGSVVAVGPGRYDGPFVVARSLTILGEGRPTLGGRRQGTIVRITAPDVTLRGFRLEEGGADTDRDDAGVLVEAVRARLEDLEIRDVHHGVYLKQAHHAVIRGVTIRGRAALGPNQRGDGIHFYFSTHVFAEGNDIADVRDGMYFSYSDTTVVRGNRVTRSRYGLHYMFSHANRFEDNRFTASAAGTSIMNSRDVLVRGNLFAHNRGVESFGLLQQTTERVTLEENVFLDNGVGLFFDGAVDGVVRGNLVAENFVGLEIYQSAERNRVWDNAIVGNSYPATGAGRGNVFCVNGRGNYWDDGRRYDLDGDGVSDVPFETASPLTELSRGRPALRLFLASPAAAALGWAERTFPVFDIASVTDSCPLAAPPRDWRTAGAWEAPRGGNGATFVTAGATLLLGLAVLLRGAPRGRA